jgi:Fe-S cluster assembly scaffold protein SufB
MSKSAITPTSTTFEVVKNEHKQIRITESGHYEVRLVGSGAEVEIAGTFMAEDKDVVDVTVIIRHQAPHTRADTTLRGVGRDQAQVRFVGRIIIEENCGDTNSFLTERILLLSDQAKAEAVPDLEIESDDVKCSHAASISRIPEEHLFYLMSRGLSRQAAEEALIEGFLEINS